MPKEREFYVSELYLIAMNYVDSIITNEEILKNNLTELFWHELEKIIEKAELIRIQLLGRVRKGKSTVGIKLGKEIFKLLQKYGYIEKDKKYGMNNIARDQAEKSLRMRDPETEYTVLVTDEKSKLEEGGENATVEKQAQEQMSEVQAARYIHQVDIAPSELLDEQSEIMLEVIAADEKDKITHCHLYYRIYKAEAGTYYNQLVGYVNISVADIIEKWEEVKKHFLKPDRMKTKEDRRIIKQAREQDFYVEYMIKKHQKMELLTKKGIARGRLLGKAAIILKVIKDLGDIVGVMRQNELRETVRGQLKIELRKAKVFTSIIGDEIILKDTMSIINLIKTVDGIKQTTQVLRVKIKEEEKTEDKINLNKLKIELDRYEKAAARLEEGIKIQLAELEELKQVNEEYNQIITK